MSDQRKPPAPPGDHRKVQSDERGRSVWVDTIRTAEFELVSTQTLQALLDEGDAAHRGEIERIASDGDDGYLAKDSSTGRYRIIDDDSLQAILDQQDESMPVTRIGDTVRIQRPDIDATEAAEEESLSLVSTQSLRKILDDVQQEKPGAKKKPRKDEGGGFDPYNAG